MGIDKIIQLVAVLVAIVAGVMHGFPYSDVLIALFGIAGAWFIADDDRMRFLVAAVALGVAYAGLNAIPAIGPYFTDALQGLSQLYYAAAATVVVLGLVNRLTP